MDHPDLNPYRRIEAMLEEIRAIVESADCTRGCILGNLALETSRDNEGFRERIAPAFGSWSELEKARDSGGPPADFDSRAYAYYAISALEGGIMISKVTRDPYPMSNSINMILRHLAEYMTTWQGWVQP
ncbi:MAG: TetR family transcriptional regulator C-terminal domain-containing protein [Actinomycetota bacterium]|nr:TetR family transcriptional regulator C-terminal domain-containing protein [Actinomycetota bacterium]